MPFYLVIREGSDIDLDRLGLEKASGVVEVQPIAWTNDTTSHRALEVNLPKNDDDCCQCVNECIANDATTMVEGVNLSDALMSVGLEVNQKEEDRKAAGEAEFVVVVDEADVAVLNEAKGKVNANTVGSWAPGTGMFLGFVGSRGEDGRYHGVLRMGPCGDGEADRFEYLPGVDAKPKKSRKRKTAAKSEAPETNEGE